MIERPPKEEILSIIKEIESDPAASQRKLSKKLGISLGKINYLLKELIKKGLIKAKNFSKNPGKLGKIHYILTPSGFEAKVHMMSLFLNKKEIEYNLLKKELDELKKNGITAPVPQKGPQATSNNKEKIEEKLYAE